MSPAPMRPAEGVLWWDLERFLERFLEPMVYVPPAEYEVAWRSVGS